MIRVGAVQFAAVAQIPRASGKENTPREASSSWPRWWPERRQRSQPTRRRAHRRSSRRRSRARADPRGGHCPLPAGARPQARRHRGDDHGRRRDRYPRDRLARDRAWSRRTTGSTSRSAPHAPSAPTPCDRQRGRRRLPASPTGARARLPHLPGDVREPRRRGAPDRGAGLGRLRAGRPPCLHRRTAVFDQLARALPPSSTCRSGSSSTGSPGRDSSCRFLSSRPRTTRSTRCGFGLNSGR